MTSLKRLLITPGEPAGIGPDLILSLARQNWHADVILIADPDLLRNRAHELNLDVTLQECDLTAPRQTHQPGTLRIFPVKLIQPVETGKLNPANAAYVLRTLYIAAEACLKHKADAIVTGPVHKGVMNEAKIPFTGHTEFFADICDVPRTVMLFVVDSLKVALATTHLPLARVPDAITPDLLRQTLTLLHSELKRLFHIPSPHILVCGLNPHAGEGGHFGREEIDIMIPVLNQLRDQGLQITGPLPADTLFTPRHLQQADAVLAMYHDQALPIVKYLGFDRAVNITLGLPFVRTSVDHGTALDLAGTGRAETGSLAAAMELAIKMKTSSLLKQ